MIRNQARIRRTDLVTRLYSTWDSLEFQESFHAIYWADFHDYDSLVESLQGRRKIASYVWYFYDQVGALLRRNLIDFDLVDDLLGNSATQLWAKIEPVFREARTRSEDPRLYEHFEYLYDQMTDDRTSERCARRLRVHLVPQRSSVRSSSKATR
jgi:hypothetical protein